MTDLGERHAVVHRLQPHRVLVVARQLQERLQQLRRRQLRLHLVGWGVGGWVGRWDFVLEYRHTYVHT